jgi:hypothetical protein
MCVLAQTEQFVDRFAAVITKSPHKCAEWFWPEMHLHLS